MEYLILLSVSSAIIAALTFLIWKRTGSIAFVIGIFFLFYWSLAGSWIFYFDAISGFQGEKIGLHYYYIFEKMFPVGLDHDFFMSILYYAIFIIVVQLGILISYGKVRNVDFEPMLLSTGRMLAFTAFFLVASLLFVFPEIKSAFENNLILYYTIELSDNKFLTLHQFLLQLAITSLLMATGIFLSKNAEKMRLNKVNIGYLIIFLFVLGITMSFLMILGNKKELLFSGMLAILFFLSNNKLSKSNIKRLAILIFIVLIPLMATDIIRGAKFRSLLSLDLVEKEPSSKKRSKINLLGMVLFSNELFFSNFSMYGVLNQEIPQSTGISVKYLGSSLIPRVIKAERPEDVYTYYARKTNLVEGQGYTIHHATAWYLNFGRAGIIAGALIFGLIWGKLSSLKLSSKRSDFKLILIFLVPAITCAYIPILVRNGMEVYKSFLIEGVLLTSLIIYLSRKEFHPKKLLWWK